MSEVFHSFYGGAHLFSSSVFPKLQSICVKYLELFQQNDQICNLIPPAAFETCSKQLKTMPISDYRIDFEDGLGNGFSRPQLMDLVRKSAKECASLASDVNSAIRPARIGIRTLCPRGKTYQLSKKIIHEFLTTYLSSLKDTQKSGNLCELFIVTLPKIQELKDVKNIVRTIVEIERKFKLKPRTIRVEIMMEHPALLNAAKRSIEILNILDYLKDRCLGAHFGIFDYLSEMGVPSPQQSGDHPFYEVFKWSILNAIAGKKSGGNVEISEGVIQKMVSLNDSRERVSEVFQSTYSWHYKNMSQGIFRSWDIHPCQVVMRLLALHAYFQQYLDESVKRLQMFYDNQSKAQSLNGVFDDMASIRGLEIFIRKGVNCGAINRSLLPEFPFLAATSAG